MDTSNVEYIQWRDTVNTGTSWNSLDDIEKATALATCRSFGYVLHEDSRRLIVVPHVILQKQDANHVYPTQGYGSLSIPVSSIEKRVVLQITDLQYSELLNGMLEKLRASGFTQQDPAKAVASAMRSLNNHRKLCSRLSALLQEHEDDELLPVGDLLDIVTEFNNTREKLKKGDST